MYHINEASQKFKFKGYQKVYMCKFYFSCLNSIKLKMKRNIDIYIDLTDLSIFNCELNFLTLAH